MTEPKDELNHNIYISVPFPTARIAEIVYQVLVVDTEPKRSCVTKQLSLNNSVLEVKFSAELAKQLRVAVGSFFENIILITETIDLLGPPVSDKYSY